MVPLAVQVAVEEVVPLPGRVVLVEQARTERLESGNSSMAYKKGKKKGSK